MGWYSIVQPYSVGGVRGGGEGQTQEHAQECTRECCTYPLATYPLKSARTVPVPLSVRRKNVPTGPVSGSGSVPAPPCRLPVAQIGPLEPPGLFQEASKDHF